MKDYKKELSQLSDDHKLELWKMVKDNTLSEQTKYRQMYYIARAKKYL